MKSGERLWGANPIRLFHEWWHDATRTTAAHIHIEEESVAVDNRDLQFALQKADIHPKSSRHPGILDNNVFPLNSTNARQWTDIFLQSLETLESALDFVRPSVVDNIPASMRSEQQKARSQNE